MKPKLHQQINSSASHSRVGNTQTSAILHRQTAQAKGPTRSHRKNQKKQVHFAEHTNRSTEIDPKKGNASQILNQSNNDHNRQQKTNEQITRPQSVKKAHCHKAGCPKSPLNGPISQLSTLLQSSSQQCSQLNSKLTYYRKQFKEVTEHSQKEVNCLIKRQLKERAETQYEVQRLENELAEAKSRLQSLTQLQKNRKRDLISEGKKLVEIVAEKQQKHAINKALSFEVSELHQQIHKFEREIQSHWDFRRALTAEVQSLEAKLNRQRHQNKLVIQQIKEQSKLQSKQITQRSQVFEIEMAEMKKREESCLRALKRKEEETQVIDQRNSQLLEENKELKQELKHSKELLNKLLKAKEDGLQLTHTKPLQQSLSTKKTTIKKNHQSEKNSQFGEHDSDRQAEDEEDNRKSESEFEQNVSRLKGGKAKENQEKQEKKQGKNNSTALKSIEVESTVYPATKELQRLLEEKNKVIKKLIEDKRELYERLGKQ